MTLTEFLEARIAEDEAAAKAASVGPWAWAGDAAEDQAFLFSGNGDPIIDAYGNHTEGYLECSDADRVHVARHDPARVLAECSAKRAILARVPRNSDPYDPGGYTSVHTIRALAAVYSDHPDYDPAWPNG